MHSTLRSYLSVNKYDKIYYWGKNVPPGAARDALLFLFYSVSNVNGYLVKLYVNIKIYELILRDHFDAYILKVRFNRMN